ncbi:mitochondrial membrane protein [Sorochytrium milnesiophthora]
MSYAVEAEVPITAKQLAILKHEYTSQLPNPELQTVFNYAWGLVRSVREGDIQLGVRLFKELLATTPALQREVLYYASLGEYKLGNYTDARFYVDQLLNLEPGNKQALSMRDLVDRKVKKDGMIGLALVGGVVAAAGVIIGSLLSKKH